MQFTLTFLSIVLGVLSGGLFWADEESLKFLQEIDKRIYRPVDNGLKDLSITITHSLFKNHPTFGPIQAQFYFKAGEKKSQKLILQGLEQLPEDIKKVSSQVVHLENQALQFFQSYSRELIGKNFEEKLNDYEQITLKRDVDYDRLLMVPKTGSSLKKYFLSQTLVCQNFRILSIETVNLNGTQTQSKFTYQEVNGKILIDKVESRVSSEQASYRYEYQTLNEVILIRKILGKATNGSSFEIEFTNTKVNEGLKDDIFED
ncbi:MAG: hypothetical protein AABZ60_07660 [Planctomycetota bacterium]